MNIKLYKFYKKMKISKKNNKKINIICKINIIWINLIRNPTKKINLFKYKDYKTIYNFNMCNIKKCMSNTHKIMGITYLKYIAKKIKEVFKCQRNYLQFCYPY